MQSLLEYMRDSSNDIPEEMIWKKSAINQMIFFRDRIGVLFYHGLDMFNCKYGTTPEEHLEYERCRKLRDDFVKIRSFHTSKSISLPVYQINLNSKEVDFIVARYNFYNWNVSIRSTKEVILPDYFRMDRAYDYCFLEGMTDMRLPKYSEDRNNFMFHMSTHEELFAVMWCIADQVVEGKKSWEPR
jgi:hypothetical protein